MKIVDIRCMRGPSYWSVKRHKLIVMRLDLEELEECPTNLIPGFHDRIQTLLPSLHSHECSEGHPGGFFERVKDGTWMGHVIEHIALEIQTLAGMDCGFGRTRSTGEHGVYNVVFEFKEEKAGVHAARCAVAIAQALINDQPYDIQADVEELKRLYESEKLGPSTSAIVEACVRKGIPHIRLNDDSYVQLGYGSKQKRIEATITSQTSSLAVEIASNKALTKEILSSAGIPVPEGVVIKDESELCDAVKQVGFPLVIKPLDGNHGRGVTTDIRDGESALDAFRLAREHSEEVIVERFIVGSDYRLLVINYKLRAAARRTPACIVGDGTSTIQQLIDKANQDPRRGEGHQNVLTKIVVDATTLSLLQDQELTLDSVVEAGQEVLLKKAANLSMGGTATDVTDKLHPEIVFMAERAARAIGLDVCGIDMMALNIARPLKESGAAIMEVNAAPGFRMHTHPTEGQARDVGGYVADMLFPEGTTSRIPIISVTGTNGKTTTTRLTAHLMQQTGNCVGYTTTDGIYICNHLIEEGDCTGPDSARTILKDPAVDVAVLECARGGLLRSGLAFDQCDASIVTNVAADHLGLKDINSLEEMAYVKAVIPETVKKDGYAILNADNDYTYAMRERLKCRIALFSMHADNERILEHTKAGGMACVFEDNYITLLVGSEKIRVESVMNIPATFEGKCRFMIENALGAVLAAYTQGVSVDLIAQGLRSFEISAENTPGRMNMFHFKDFDVLIDYAHNPHGLSALGQYLHQVPATSKVGIITGVGDRRDEDIRALGMVAAQVFDEVIIRVDEDLRGRKTQEIINLIKRGIRAINPSRKIRVIQDELQAVNYAIRHVKPGNVIVLLTEKVSQSVSLVREFMELDKQYGLTRKVELKVNGEV
ncbi:cyanophycin synthetase [Telluribacter sp. SYSU D00476]|uniref:cyanophycin synthetase n=1 Tax=Telluribacter sp. SYSU D00476 TaxID=2811430 RepID=UPI001FF6712C|nr:cyanophycin synthetase [Telluribacter sp. SYSU D00476]